MAGGVFEMSTLCVEKFIDIVDGKVQSLCDWKSSQSKIAEKFSFAGDLVNKDWRLVNG